MRNIIIEIVCILLLTSCSAKVKQEKGNISQVIIYYQSWTMEMPFSVGCDEFLGFFIDSDKIIINDPVFLERFEQALLNLKCVENHPEIMDVRIKMFIYDKNNNYSAYCIDMFFISNEDKYYILSKQMYELLKEISVIEELQ